jgi:hypothetical protein
VSLHQVHSIKLPPSTKSPTLNVRSSHRTREKGLCLRHSRVVHSYATHSHGPLVARKYEVFLSNLVFGCGFFSILKLPLFCEKWDVKAPLPGHAEKNGKNGLLATSMLYCHPAGWHASTGPLNSVSILPKGWKKTARFWLDLACFSPPYNAL